VRRARLVPVPLFALALAACAGGADPGVATADVPTAADPAPPGAGPDAGIAAADELLARWRLGETGSWRVDERYARTRPDGEALTWDLVVVRRPPDVLVVGGGLAHGVLDGRAVTCEVGPEPRCTEPARAVTYDPGAALDGALGPGGYEVAPAGTADVAGETADCYALTAGAGGGERPLGERAELCLTADGIPLRVVVDHGGIVERREAVAVDRDVDAAEVTALLAGA
jgi:hypothetical protein